MGDLSTFLPTESTTVAAIYDWHKNRGDTESARGYLGASILGHECSRFLWYSFRLCVKPDFPGRLYRLFETGDIEEGRFVKELRSIGCEVYDLDETGQQFEIRTHGGHHSGHMDGSALGILEAPKTWHVLEFKTHNKKSYTALKKDGVQVSKPQHYAQMQDYMGNTGMTRALYLAKNKDTDELYSERVKFDAAYFKGLMDKADRIIRTQQPPERITERLDDFRCKFCDAYDLCWGTSDVAVPLPSKTCRTCCHATPEIDEGENWARWSCAKHKNDVTLAEQLQACPSHLLLPGLVSFGEATDAGDDYIEFTNTSTPAVWHHGAGGKDGTWTTEELMLTPGPLVGEKAIESTKAIFGGTVLGVDDLSLIEQYPPEDSRLRWEGRPMQVEEGLGHPDNKDLAEAFGGNHTNQYISDEKSAFEYAGKFLFVHYKADNYAAIWEGKE